MITLFEDFESEHYIATEDDFNFVEPGDVLIAKCDIYITKKKHKHYSTKSKTSIVIDKNKYPEKPYMCPRELSLSGDKLFVKKGSKKTVKKDKYGYDRFKLTGFNGRLSNEVLSKLFTIKDKDKIENLKNIKKFNL